MTRILSNLIDAVNVVCIIIKFISLVKYMKIIDLKCKNAFLIKLVL